MPVLVLLRKPHYGTGLSTTPLRGSVASGLKPDATEPRSGAVPIPRPPRPCGELQATPCALNLILYPINILIR